MNGTGHQSIKAELTEASSVQNLVSMVERIDGLVLCAGVGNTNPFNSTMKFCAKELAPKKIRVNSVNPGMVNTQLITSGIISEEQYKLDMERYPLKRYGEPEEIAWGIIYLLSEASAWTTGHSLVIDGGVTI